MDSAIAYYAFLSGVTRGASDAAPAAAAAAAAAAASGAAAAAAAAPKKAKAAGAAATAAAAGDAAPAKEGRGKRSAVVHASGDDKVTFNADKNVDFPLWFEQICVVAEIVDKRYPVKGMPVMRPYGFYMHNQIMRMIEDEWEGMGTQVAQFPSLIPRSFLAREKEHIKGFENECFWVTHGGVTPLEEPCALRPTSETAMYFMFSKWVRSYRDLPLQVHQTCPVYRHETKDTRPLIRVREIHWNEAHTCHESAEQALRHLEEAWGGYLRVLHGRLGMTGMRLRRPDWDRFAGAEHTDVMDSVMPCGRVLQTIGAHYLGQKFAKVFDITFLNREQKPEFAYMTCYGISTRCLAATIAAHGDNRGLVVPPAIARQQIVIVPIISKKSTPELSAYCSTLLEKLRAAGMRVQLDDSDKKPGDKFYFWEMKGVPLRLEVGDRDRAANKVVLVRRDTLAKTDVALDALVAHIRATFDTMTSELHAKAEQYLKEHITPCTTIDEVAAALRTKGGFARIPFFTSGFDGKEADEKLRELTGGEVRGFSPLEAPPAPGTLCVVTGKPAKIWGYVARSY